MFLIVIRSTRAFVSVSYNSFNLDMRTDEWRLVKIYFRTIKILLIVSNTNTMFFTRYFGVWKFTWNLFLILKFIEMFNLQVCG